jgi:uncharacterized protein (TIGR02448 family)
MPRGRPETGLAALAKTGNSARRTAINMNRITSLHRSQAMRRTLLIASFALCLPAASSFAADWHDYATSAGISASLYSTFKDDKLVVAAQDDASSFVASNGEIRGPYLEAALQQVRSAHPGLQADDMQLATAILAGPPPAR